MTEEESNGFKSFFRKIAIAVIAGLVVQSIGFLFFAGMLYQTVQQNESRSMENRVQITELKDWLRPIEPSNRRTP